MTDASTTRSSGRFRALQTVGLVWTLFYAAAASFGPGAFRGSDAESVLVLLVLPVSCLLTVFGLLRNGGALAFTTLTLATLLLSYSMRDPGGPVITSSLFSMIVIGVGSPLSLASSLWRWRKARRS